MQGKEQKIVIDGITFQVAPFMATEGLRLKAHLVRTFGPALGEILGGIDGNKVSNIADMNLGGSGITAGIEKLVEQLDESSFIALIERLFVGVIASWNEGGKPRSIAFATDFEAAMQLVFLGRLFSVYELIIFVLKVNYPDFFSKVVSGIGKKIQQTPTSVTAEATSKDASEMSETLED
jgi:hypothetical protein